MEGVDRRIEAARSSQLRLLDLLRTLVPSETRPFCHESLPCETMRYFFHCRTCGRSHGNTCFLCWKCYHNSDHIGHTVDVVVKSSAFCCCGLKERMDPAGFCKCHGKEMQPLEQKMVDEFTSTFVEFMRDVSMIGHMGREYTNVIRELCKGLLEVVVKDCRALAMMAMPFSDADFLERTLRNMCMMVVPSAEQILMVCEKALWSPQMGRAYVTVFYRVLPVVLNSLLMEERQGVNEDIVKWNNVVEFFGSTMLATSIDNEADMIVANLMVYFKRVFQIKDRKTWLVLEVIEGDVVKIFRGFSDVVIVNMMSAFAKLFITVILKQWSNRSEDADVRSSDHRAFQYVLRQMWKAMAIHDPKSSVSWEWFVNIFSKRIDDGKFDKTYTGDVDWKHRNLVCRDVDVPGAFGLADILMIPLTGDVDVDRQWMTSLGDRCSRPIDEIMSFALVLAARYSVSFQVGITEYISGTRMTHESYLSVKERMRTKKCYWLIQEMFQLFDSEIDAMNILVGAFGAVDALENKKHELVTAIVVVLAIILFDRSHRSDDREESRLAKLWFAMSGDPMPLDMMLGTMHRAMVHMPLGSVLTESFSKGERCFHRKADFKWHLIQPGVNPVALVNVVAEFMTSNPSSFIPFPAWNNDSSLARYFVTPVMFALEYSILWCYVNGDESLKMATMIVMQFIMTSFDIFGTDSGINVPRELAVSEIGKLYDVFGEVSLSFGDFLHVKVKIGDTCPTSFVDMLKAANMTQANTVMSHMGIVSELECTRPTSRKDMARQVKAAVLEQFRDRQKAVAGIDVPEDEVDGQVCAQCGLKGSEASRLHYPLFVWRSCIPRRLGLKTDLQGSICLHERHASCRSNIVAEDGQLFGYQCPLDKRLSNGEVLILEPFKTTLSDAERADLAGMFSGPLIARNCYLSLLSCEVAISELRSRTTESWYSLASAVFVREVFNCCWIAEHTHICTVTWEDDIPIAHLIRSLIIAPEPAAEFDPLVANLIERVKDDARDVFLGQSAILKHMLFVTDCPFESIPNRSGPTIEPVDLPQWIMDFDPVPCGLFDPVLVVDVLTGEIFTYEGESNLFPPIKSDEYRLMLHVSGGDIGALMVICRDRVDIPSPYISDRGLSCYVTELRLDSELLRTAIDIFISGKWANRVTIEM